MTKQPKPKRTIDQKPDYQGFPKAGELIHVTGAAHLSLQDRRVFNLLIAEAGDKACDDVQHHVPISTLRGSHKGAERVKDSIERLMTTLVHVPVTGRNDKPATLRVQLLSDTTTSDDDADPTGEVAFSFSPGLRSIIKNSLYWGRIRPQVMFAFTSKYSLALYELTASRVNLKHKDSQIFGMVEMRALLGVPEDKLKLNSDFLRYCIQPAVIEVNGLSDFDVELEPIRRGGTMRGIITGFRMTWARKSLPEMHKAHAELASPKVGRLARLTGTAETPVSEPVQTDLTDYLAALPHAP